MLKSPGQFQGQLLHVGRVALVVGIVLFIHAKHGRFLAAGREDALAQVSLAEVQSIAPDVAALRPAEAQADTRDTLDATGARSGFILVTSPAGDQSIGFSGPTNVLIVCDTRAVIQGVAILASRDTREHVRQVRNDPRFLRRYAGLTLQEAAARTRVEAVSGATLTSDAIAEAIVKRLGGSTGSLKFPDAVSLTDLQQLFPTATRYVEDRDDSEIGHVYVETKRIGSYLRTAPAGDNTVGYQGPTEALIGFDPDGRVIGFVLRKSFDNQPYVGYVREDEYFRNLFNGKSASALGQAKPQPPDVEGVSGATMTSLAVAQAIVEAAAQQQRRQTPVAVASQSYSFSPYDMATLLVILAAIVVGTTNLRGRFWPRLVLRLTVLIYLGFVAGALLSQAQLVGWAQSGIPLAATGLLALTAAALALPIATKRNIYCSHLCPHGAAQQLIKLVVRPRWSLGRRWRSWLSWIPGLLLLVAVAVGITHWPLSLVDIEPFDAYVLRIAGWATLAIAGIGLIASCFVPLAYCRFGCPTGALLEFVRRNAHSGRFSLRDALAIGLFLAALALAIVT